MLLSLYQLAGVLGDDERLHCIVGELELELGNKACVLPVDVASVLR